MLLSTVTFISCLMNSAPVPVLATSVSSCHFQNTSHRQDCSCNSPSFHLELLEDASNPSVKSTVQLVEMVFTCHELPLSACYL